MCRRLQAAMHGQPMWPRQRLINRMSDQKQVVYETSLILPKMRLGSILVFQNLPMLKFE
jgi:hypothetical protein